MATGPNIVEKAIDQLNSTLNVDDRHCFVNTTLKELWVEVRNIEREQGLRRDLRFMARIERFLRSMESYAPVIEVFCQGYSAMAFVWVNVVGLVISLNG